MLRSPLSARAFFRNPVGYVQNRPERVLRVEAGLETHVIVRDPGAVWRVLVSDGDSFVQGKWKRRARRSLGDTLNTLDGSQHRRRRLLLQPALARQRVGAFAPAALSRAQVAQQAWDDGARIDVRREFDALSLVIAGDVLITCDLAGRAREMAQALRTVMAAMPRFTPPLRITRHGRALAHVDGVVMDLIARRRAVGGEDDDLLGRLIAAGLADEVVRADIIAFLLASVDEPPSALEAAMWLLALNPVAQERLHDELDACMGSRSVAPEDLDRLPYLDAALAEALRLFPPARHIDRCPRHPVQVDGEDIEVGANVIVSPVVIHRDPSVYERPDEFLPERWLEPEESKRTKGAYVPFGGGVHTCIGEPLARLIMSAALAAVFHRWRVHVAPGTSAPVPGAPRLTVTLERR